MPAVGDRIVDRYRVIAPLGSGGMATVWRAHDERLDRDVAIKVLLPNLAGDPVVARRFEQEARAMAAIAHPGLVAVFDVDAGDPATGREPFVVMELCPGGSLADRFGAEARMPPDELVPILVAVGDALAALHRAGLVHRDVKPANILFAADRVKLGDFGLARTGVDGPDVGATALTEPGTAIGTLAYLAPERLRGEAAEPAADVYALATVAYLGLTGSLPRPTGSISDAVASAAFRAPAVSVAAPTLGRFFDEPIAAALAVDAARRPDPLAFGSAMAAALGRWSRAGRPGSDASAPAASPGTAAVLPTPAETSSPSAPVDGDEDVTTAIAIPVGGTSPYEVPPPASTARPAATRPRTSTGGRLVVAASVIVALLIAGAVIAGLLSRGQSPITGSAAPGSSASPSVARSASPATSPSPAPTAAATADPAIAALDAMDRAIAAAKGGPDGLKGKEANELEELVGRIRNDLDRGDRERALRDARELERRVREAADDLDGDVADRLRSAADALVTALGG